MADRWAERRAHTFVVARWSLSIPYVLRLKAAHGSDTDSVVIGLPDDRMSFVYEQVASWRAPAYTLVMPRDGWYESAVLLPADGARPALDAGATVGEFFDRLRVDRSLALDGLEARWFDAPEREPA